MKTAAFAALSAASLAAAASQGFNYGATNSDGSCRFYQDFFNQYQRARELPNAPGFTSARLYTSIQCGSTNAPIEAIKAAIDSETELLLGLWASAGQESINQEIAAIVQAVDMWGQDFADRVVGISVGSEDLYRASPQGELNNAGVGADADAIVNYVNQVRQALAGTVLEGKPIGHTDTWTAWSDGANAGVVGAVDFLGHNAFPYFETTQPNSIDDAINNFNSGLAATEGASQGKPVWITETGWPFQGAQSGSATASVDNAKRYWDDVGCTLFGETNTWWYTLVDANTAQTDINFAIVNEDPNAGPRFDLTCPA